MYLAELRIEGFRKFKEITIKFKKGLNILVGANNIGKTAIIDAIRSLLTANDPDFPVRFDEFDLHIDNNKKSPYILFKYIFKDLTENDEVAFFQALQPIDTEEDPQKFEIHLSTKYTLGENHRLKPKRWYGDFEENIIPSDMIEELQAIYLPPLRNVETGLKPGRKSKIAHLMERICKEENKQEIEKSLKEFDEKLKENTAIIDVKKNINVSHTDMLGEILKQLLDVKLSPTEFNRFLSRLELLVNDFDIEQNGLGYNNLIYMAVVLADLELNNNVSYRSLIIEEPEAHLHPQLQSILLNYLERAEIKNKEKIQIFITSHSADFASIANIDSLCCIHENNKEIKAFYPREIEFEKGIKEKLQRYLDITRAALFFARKIILVEGTGELFMISALSERLNKDLKKNSVSLLSTEGINFNCFIPLFGKDALNIPIVIISDADPKGNKFPNIGDNLDPSTTAKKLQSTENDFIKVFLAQKTLEYDLALHVNNHQIMIDVLKSLHKRIGGFLEKRVIKVDDKDKPKEIFEGMFYRKNKKGKELKSIKKGEYAQALSMYLLENPEKEFIVPKYIQDALKFVIGD